MMKTLVLAVLFCFSNLYAVVWEAKNEWDESYELKYREWIKSEEVNPKIFVDPLSPYNGLFLDCADLAYVLRAIFAYENELPYAVKNPVATKKSKLQFFSNEMDKWDAKEQNIKIRSFLNYISNSLGSETLSFYDTYSVKLDKIASGDIYLFKIEKVDEAAVKHTYIIKKVNEKGLFDLIYSTQSVKEEKKAFYLRKNKQISPLFLPQAPRGFKRMKWPSHYVKPNVEVTIPVDQSNEQYKLATQMGGEKFFKYLQKLLQVRPETYLEELSRLMDDLCFTFAERKNVVAAAQKYLLKIENRCMDYKEYDTFSTPSMDNTLIQEYQELKKKYELLTEARKIEISKTKTGKKLLILLENIGDDTSNLCSIKFKDNSVDYTLNIKDFMNSLLAKKASFHPNDSQLKRWGMDQAEEPTLCKTWYGQE